MHSMPTSTKRWTADDVPDQTGKVALITGANSGIGLEAARVLAERGARVVLACRSDDKAARALDEIRAARPQGEVEALRLDLASLVSVREAALRLQARHDRLDLLINNAGIMAVPAGRTAEGFELQFGTNHLGHFALTGLLLERLLATPDSRVVTISSGGHRMGSIDFQDLNWERGYGRWRAYGRSKLANLLFTNELQRRLESSGSKTIAVAAHPGGSATNLGRRAPNEPRAWVERVLRPISSLLAQSAAMGALPTLRAATDPDVVGGEYYGPNGPGEFRGLPVRVSSNRASRDPELATRLWTVSEELTGVRYAATEPSTS
jgi:NAD(P)-dependent dehydrogenase (short-subunit alcohol dehydrogenase family)